jgi:hypothetical protein
MTQEEIFAGVSFEEKPVKLLQRLYFVIGAVVNSRTRLIF